MEARDETPPRAPGILTGWSSESQSRHDPDSGATTPLWPRKNAGLHPAVAKMPPGMETSIESVARYIAREETDPFLRVKALHD